MTTTTTATTTTTTNANETPLFPPTLIPPSASTSLPKNYRLRPLNRSDYTHGYLTCLSHLTWIGDDISQSAFEQRFDWMETKGKEWYYCIVIEYDDEEDGEKMVVAAATMIVDRKFIQNFTTVAHVEEVSVSASHQKKGLGKLVIDALTATAKNLGVDKLILDCSRENIGFYEKCGYEVTGGVHMALKVSKGKE